MDVQMSLNKIADTLKININYEDGVVTGSTPMIYSPLPGLEIPVTVTLKAFFANEAVGVMAHVVGDLYLVVSHVWKTGAVNVFMVNGAVFSNRGETPYDLIAKTMSIKVVVATLRKGITVAFLWKDRRWSVLNLPV